MNTKDFLEKVITTNEGFFLLANRENGHWQEHWFNWPTDCDKLIDYSANLPGDIYFSSHLFDSCKSTKARVLPTRTIQSDLDNASITNLPFEPTVLVKTSDGRHHAYWHCSTDVTEQISKTITYSIYDCDLSGWTLGHRMRLPNTLNYKYKPPQQCEVVSSSYNIITPEQIHLLPVENIQVTDDEIAWINDYIPQVDVGPYELLESIKTHISIKVYVVRHRLFAS